MMMMKRMMMMIIDFSHPKSTGRGAAENEVSCLEQVEVVAHVVHHIPDQDHSHVIDLDFCDVDGEDDLKTVLPWKKYPLVMKDFLTISKCSFFRQALHLLA